MIIDSDTGFASSTNILNLVDQLKGKKMRKKEAEHVLQKFVQNKWLIEVFVTVGFPAWLTFIVNHTVSSKWVSVELSPFRSLISAVPDLYGTRD